MKIYRKPLQTDERDIVDYSEIGCFVYKDSYIEDRTPFSNISVEITDIDNEFLEHQYCGNTSDLEFQLSDCKEFEDIEDGYYFVVLKSKFEVSQGYFDLLPEGENYIEIVSITEIE